MNPAGKERSGIRILCERCRALLSCAALFTLFFLFAATQSTLAQPGNRVALVIGNSTYEHAQYLPNPANDANDMAAALTRLGFKVTKSIDATHKDMSLLLSRFGQSAQGAELAVIYFAGHGMQYANDSGTADNWVIPVDATLESAGDVSLQTFSLQQLMTAVSHVDGAGLIILDACRNNPFLSHPGLSNGKRDTSRGFTRADPVPNVLVAFAAREGTTASDGEPNSRHSPFTLSLLQNIEKPGVEIRFLFDSVRDDVLDATHRAQQPISYQSLGRRQFYLASPPASPPAPDDTLWSVIEGSKLPGYFEEFLRRYPNSPHAAAARAQIDELKKQQVAAVVPNPAPSPAGSANSVQGASAITLGDVPRPVTTIHGQALQFSPFDDAVPNDSVLRKEGENNNSSIFSKPPDLASAALPPSHVDASVAADSVKNVAAIRDKYRDWSLSVAGGHDNDTATWHIAVSRTRLASLHVDRKLRIWDLASHRLLSALSIPKDAEGGISDEVSISSDGSRVLTLTNEIVRVWDTVRGEVLRTLPRVPAIHDAIISSDGRRIVTATVDKTVKVWDAATGGVLHTIKTEDQVMDLAFSADGKSFAGSDWHAVKLWDLESGKLLRELKTKGIRFGAISPDKRLVASWINPDDYVRVWDLASGKLLRTFETHQNGLIRFAFSPDGRWIASGDKEGFIKIWDLKTGDLLATQRASGGITSGVLFSQDSTQLIVAYPWIRFWDMSKTEPQMSVTLMTLKEASVVVVRPDGSFWTDQAGLSQLELSSGKSRTPLPDDYKAVFLRDKPFDEAVSASK